MTYSALLLLAVLIGMLGRGWPGLGALVLVGVAGFLLAGVTGFFATASLPPYARAVQAIPMRAAHPSDQRAPA